MIDFLLKIAEAEIDYRNFLVYFLAYIGILWLMFSLWVFFDAYKRFNRIVFAVLFFFIVFVFNFPALIFYLIIRPENEDEEFVILNPHHGVHSAAFNVPIINFKNGDETVIGLEIKINKNVFNPNLNVSITDAKEASNISVNASVSEKDIYNESKEREFNFDVESNLNKWVKIIIAKIKKLLVDIQNYSKRIESSASTIANEKQIIKKSDRSRSAKKERKLKRKKRK
jgi:hypothetical protein